MPSLPHHWFVQTSFGALLGPMPADALAEMARTGALLTHDRVREGTDGEWRPASQVSGLFDEQTPSLGLLSSTLEDLFAPENSAPRHSTASPTADRRAPTSPEETPVTSESQELDFEVDTPLIAPPAAAELHRGEPELEFEIDAPLIAPTTQSLTRFESEPVKDLVTHEDPPSLREPETVLPTPSGWQGGVSRRRWQPTVKRSRGLHIDQQVWIKGTIAAVLFLGLVSTWWFWPRQRPDLYKNYVAIYQELQSRRDLSADHAAWMEFVTRAKTQLAETVPWLEEKAKPGDREKSLLLYAGRDLQELLELPRTSKSPHLQRLDAFFEQLQELYGSN